MKSYVIIILSMVFFSACKKDNSTTTPTLTTTQKIQNKWSIVSVMDYNYVGASTTLDYIDTTYVGTSADYIEFRADNKTYGFVAGGFDTSQYTILSDTKMLFDGDTFTINNLTSSDFKFTYYERKQNPYYDNVITLKR